MRYTALASVLLASAAAWLASAGQTPPPSTGRHELQLNGHTFTLPDGFEIELVAGPPLVDRPIVADFDQVRLRPLHRLADMTAMPGGIEPCLDGIECLENCLILYLACGIEAARIQPQLQPLQYGKTRVRPSLRRLG